MTNGIDSTLDGSLLLRETVHRCSNDLQLIVGLLALEERRSSNVEVRAVLRDIQGRVSVLSRARAALVDGSRLKLSCALREVCEALQAHCEPRAILLTLEIDDLCDQFDIAKVPLVALVVNELATNAIKHAFDDGESGQIRVVAGVKDTRIHITVEDNGRPFVLPRRGARTGLGMTLVRRLVAAADGEFAEPEDGEKRFRMAFLLSDPVLPPKGF